MHPKNIFLSTILLFLSSLPLILALPSEISDMTFVGSSGSSSATGISARGARGPASVKVLLCHDKDWVLCQWFKIEDYYCWRLPAIWTESISGYRVEGGCCVFWSENFCTQGYMFEATNRQHSKLGKWHNDKIKSIRCAPVNDPKDCPF
ncbi:hypothetical protein BZA77DRAFT_297943 [Pyronema omphalodes]|nr:hypothetical protein BZA77DRAFT_297943 [Pyronema omphalodes]